MMSTPDHIVERYRAKLIDAASTIERLRGRLAELEHPRPEPIAVVGLSLRMPGGAQTPEEFWSLLRQGVDTTREFPASRGDARALFHPDPDHPGTAYVIRGGFLDGVDGFDPAVFGISPREAVGMDPQQRIVLEVAWEALERAGYAPTELTGSRTGVYVGVSTTDYVRMRQQLGDVRDVDAYQLVGEPSFIAGRVSYTFGLQGPSAVIDTTCSSSLVAVHEASQALRAGECDLALAGGVNLMLSPYGFVLMSKFRALARDGRCKTFDAAADGYARGEGAGLLVLQRLSDALANRNTVLAVIRGSAVNHDGRSSGLTVPNPEAQQDVIRRALAQGGVAPRDVSYVEAHGTGTSLGDPIELRALDTVMGEGREPSKPLLVGSVKTNIGHLEPAAGVAGLIKVILALQHGEIPPHLNLATPNPKIPWRRLRIEVPTAARSWPDYGRPRVAAVSSFGASGTNTHVVVSEPDPVPAGQDRLDEHQLLLLSARTGTALRELAVRYADYLATCEHRLADICFTSQVGRARHAHGLVVVSQTRLEAAEQLSSFVRGETGSQAIEVDLAPHKARKAGWLCTGQGAQYVGMAAGLRDEPAFAEPFGHCRELLNPLLPRPLEDVLWGDPGEKALDDTRYTQPALFAVEYALGRALLSWGLRPSALLGHSVGEITAACLADAIPLPDAARLVAHRARLMAALPAGGVMAAVSCDEATARAAIDGRADRVAVAAVNGPADVVLSGSGEAVRAVADELTAAGYRTHFLTVSHAFHSPLLGPMLDEFRALLGSITVRTPEIPLISNVTGEFWTPDELDPQYWIRHAVGAVRFDDGIRRLYEHGVRTFVEVGPHPVLTGLGRKALDDPACAWIGLLRRGRDDRAQVLSGLGTLHLRGCLVDWTRVQGRDVGRVPSPTYPWERERFWFRPAVSAPAASSATVPGLGVRVRGPEPLFEQPVDAGQPVASAEDALGWLVERSVRAATAGHGGRWRRLSGATVEPPVLHEARGPWLVQSAVRLASDHAITVESSGASPEASRAGAPWRPHGLATVHRSPGALMPAPVTDAEAVWLVQTPAEGPVDEAAAWGHVVRSACGAVTAAADAGSWVHGFAEARCDAPGDVHALRVAHVAPDGAGVCADVTLWAEDGRYLGEIRGLRGDPMPAPPASRWYPEDELVYRLAWVPITERAEPLPAGNERMLLVGADTPTELLGRELRRRGASCELVHPSLDPSPEEIDGWLADGLTRVVVSGLGIPPADELTGAVLAARLFPLEQLVVQLTQRIAARSWSAPPPRIVLLTRAAAAAGDEQRTHNPAASTLWGLGRVIALEHPDYWGAAVDLDPDGDDDLAAIANAVLDVASEDQRAFRGRRQLVARLQPVPPDTLPAAPADPPHRPGTVLITGGWGGIGTAFAEWLARNGTKRLVLAGRSRLPDEATWDDPDLPAAVRTKVDTVRRLRELGVAVEAAQLDVTDEPAVAALIDRLAADPLPLRGVVHAAGVSGPQDMVEVDAARYRRVWAPKTVGAWLLHERTRHLDLDLFVCFSSVAATWGSQHLASYAAANMFLDGLAHYRRGLGLPCLVVDWGPWGLDSHLFGDDVMSFLESVGLRQLHPAQCFSLLGRMLRGDSPQYVVCAVDWATYKPVMEARTDRPVLRDITVDGDMIAGGEDQDLLNQLAEHAGDTADDRAARHRLLGDYLRSAVAGVLGIDAAGVAGDADVFALGLDSLMVMEVVTRCRRGLGVGLRPSDFFARSTLVDWTDYLDLVLRGGETDEETRGGRPEEIGDDGDSQPVTDRYVEVAAIVDRAVLADDVRPVGALGDAEPDLVLLTGATGFVGAFLLDELLASTQAEIACLVRCTDPDDGLARIRRNVQRYVPWRTEADSRVRVLPGDLARPRLGFSEAEFDALAERTGAIYHSGAWVDFVHTFDQLAPANIGGTEELLRLASRGRPKRVNHVSTYGIWGLPVPGRTRIVESEDIGTAGRLVTGYVQTKWGAEHVVRQARERGLPVRTFRLGRVLGDSRSGVCLTTHFTCRVIKGCIQLGLAPNLDDLEIEMTPVDFVAQALVHISRADTAADVFHLVNPNRMQFLDLVRFIQQRGWPVKVVDRQEWWAALRRSFDVDRNELHPVMDIVREFIVGGEEAIDYEVTCADKALAGSGIFCPPLDEQLLETYFDYFVRSGYLAT